MHKYITWNTPVRNGGVVLINQCTENWLPCHFGKKHQNTWAVLVDRHLTGWKFGSSAYRREQTSVKRYGNLYEKICSMDNLYLAFQHAKKGKRMVQGKFSRLRKRPYYYLAGPAMDASKPFIQNLRNMPLYEKRRQEGTGNIQTSILPWQNCTMGGLQVIEPQLLAYFTDDTYSAIPNKGYSCSIQELRLAVDTVPEEMIYCLKIDCKKFYPSIDHETLKQKFRRKYKDPELLELIDEVIDSISNLSGNGWKHWILSVLW